MTMIIYIHTTIFRFRVAWMEAWIWCTFKILAAIHMRKFETFWNAGRNFETRLCSPPNPRRSDLGKHEKETDFQWWKSHSGECKTAFGSPSSAELILVSIVSSPNLAPFCLETAETLLIHPLLVGVAGISSPFGALWSEKTVGEVYPLILLGLG